MKKYIDQSLFEKKMEEWLLISDNKEDVYATELFYELLNQISPADVKLVDCKELIQKIKEEIKNINPVYSMIGDRIPVLKNCEDIKAEVFDILDKILESEGK